MLLGRAGRDFDGLHDPEGRVERAMLGFPVQEQRRRNEDQEAIGGDELHAGELRGGEAFRAGAGKPEAATPGRCEGRDQDQESGRDREFHAGNQREIACDFADDRGRLEGEDGEEGDRSGDRMQGSDGYSAVHDVIPACRHELLAG
jgi:hypothetical protein